jgi:hypothetical protein
MASIVFFLLLAVQHTPAQVPTNVLFNVFQIKIGENLGTAFEMRVDGRVYLITAKHMVHDLKADGTPEKIEVRKFRELEAILEWKQVIVKIFACDDPVDIAVLVPSEVLRDFPPLEPMPDDMALGQEGFFLGFPLGIASPTEGDNAPFPMPFVKRGNLSSIRYDKQADIMYFDGYNNHGFSGGPVVYQDHRYRDPSDPTGTKFYVAGVVTGFIPELAKTANWRRAKPGEHFTGIEEWRIDKRRDGSAYILTDTTTVVPLNTGIIQAFNVHHAVDVIKAHPIGPSVSGTRP